MLCVLYTLEADWKRLISNLRKDRRRRIAFVLGSYFEENSGGAEMQAYELAKLVMKREYFLFYVYISKLRSPRSNCNICLRSVRHSAICTRLHGVKWPYILDFLWKLIQIKPDIIYQRCASALTGVAAIYSKVFGAKLVTHIASDIEIERINGDNKGMFFIDAFLLRYGVKNSSEIIVQTHQQELKIKEKYGERTHTIPNFHFIPSIQPKANKIVKVVWIANWKRSKRPEQFVELVKQLNHIRNTEFIMIGRNSSYPILMQKARELGITVMGSVPHKKVNSVLAEAHILVNTSSYEGFSNVFIQAWMREVPIVSLSVDPDCIIRDNELGYYAGNSEKLIKYTKLLIESNMLRSKMGSAARAYAQEYLSMNNAEKVIAILSKRYS